MKNVLYYSLRRSYGEWTIIGVTSERQRRVFGRNMETEEPTNAARRDIHGKFNTLDAAKAKLATIAEITATYREKIGALDARLRQLYRDRDNAFDAAVRS